MERRRMSCFLLMAVIEIMSWVSATFSRPLALAPNGHDLAVHLPLPESSSATGQSPKSLPITAFTSISPKQGVVIDEEDWRKIGSSPPNCENKCYGCNPCEAIQVPTTSKHSHLGIQYANYEPEGWKCKCGASFYSP